MQERDDSAAGHGLEIGPLRLVHTPGADCRSTEPAGWEEHAAELLFWAVPAETVPELGERLEDLCGNPALQHLMEAVDPLPSGAVLLVGEGESWWFDPNNPDDRERILIEEPAGQMGDQFTRIREQRSALQTDLLPLARREDELRKTRERLTRRKRRLAYLKLVLVRRELGRLEERREELDTVGERSRIDRQSLERGRKLASKIRDLETRQQEVSTSIVRLTRQRDQLEEYQDEELSELSDLTPEKREEAADLFRELNEFRERAETVRDELDELREGSEQQDLAQGKELLEKFGGFQLSDLDRANRLLEELESVERELAALRGKDQRMASLRGDLRVLGQYRRVSLVLLLIALILGVLFFAVPGYLQPYAAGSATLTALFALLLYGIPLWLEHRWKREALGEITSANVADLQELEQELENRQQQLTEELGFVMKVGIAEDFQQKRRTVERLLDLLKEDRGYWEKYMRLRELRREIPMLEESVNEWLRENLTSGERVEDQLGKIHEWERTSRRMRELDAEIAEHEQTLDEISGEVEFKLDQLERVTGAEMHPAMGWRERWEEFRDRAEEELEGDDPEQELEQIEQRRTQLKEEFQGDLSERISELGEHIEGEPPQPGEEAGLADVRSDLEEVNEKLQECEAELDELEQLRGERREADLEMLKLMAARLGQLRRELFNPLQAEPAGEPALVIGLSGTLPEQSLPGAQRIEICRPGEAAGDSL